MPFRCFAYGSNMFTRKMCVPAPSATFVAIGRIPGYVLRFNKKSDDNSGKGNIVGTGNPADEVWGVVFEISDAERTALDKSEGGYTRTKIDVLSETGTVRSVTYIAKPDRIDDSLKPYIWCKQFVVRGAEEHGLPPGYVAQLGAVEAMPDPDPDRDTKQRALLAPRTVDEALKSFEARSEPFEGHEVADAMRTLARGAKARGEEVTLEMRAELLGFELAEDYVHDEGFTWGTYYGPLGVAIDASGMRIESPSLEEITPDVIAYWEERARTSPHAILRMRYADLVWEFRRRVQQPASADLPRVVIDTTYELHDF